MVFDLAVLEKCAMHEVDVAERQLVVGRRRIWAASSFLGKIAVEICRAPRFYTRKYMCRPR